MTASRPLAFAEISSAARPAGTRVAWLANGSWLTLDHFRDAVATLSAQLSLRPESAWAVCCDDAARFAAATLAVLHAGKTLVLPGHSRASLLAEQFSSEHFAAVLADQSLALPCPVLLVSDFPSTTPKEISPLPEKFPSTARVVFFTSGSTGQPKRIEKSIAQLQTENDLHATHWGKKLPGSLVLGTTAHHHLYGFQFRVLLPLSLGVPFNARLIEYHEQLATAPAPFALVTSPAFLKRLDPQLPPLAARLVLSAGGFLPPEAKEISAAQLGVAPFEIYGSTETGAIAWRDTAILDARWQPLPGVQIATDATGRLALRSPFLSDATLHPTDDQISLHADGSFELLGRIDRIVKIEEKRIALPEVEERLRALPEITDAAVVPLTHASRTFLATALVLSSSGAEKFARLGHGPFLLDLRRQLRAFLEPVAIPRQLKILPCIPENSMGKRDPEQLRRLFAPTRPTATLLSVSATECTLTFPLPADLLWFQGHFPRAALLPGIAQLHWAVQFAQQHLAPGRQPARIQSLKFQSPLVPGDSVTLRLQWDETAGRLAFDYSRDGTPVSSGRLVLSPKEIPSATPVSPEPISPAPATCSPAEKLSCCIVIPCYNHGFTLPAVLRALAPLSLPVIVVDDASQPPLDAKEISSSCTAPLHLLRHESNQGKGGAVRTGLLAAARLGFSHALQIDADGQHDTAALPEFLAAARREPAALISGQPVYDASVPAARRYGRLLTHVWVWIETLSFQIKDSMCGLRIYPLAATIPLLEKPSLGRRMDFDVEILVRLFWENVPMRFLPVRVTYPVGGISHFDPLRDNLRISWMHTRLVCSLLPRLPQMLRLRFSSSLKNVAEEEKISSEKTLPASHWSRLAERRGLWGMRFLLLAYRLLGYRAFQFFLLPVISVFWFTAGTARRASRDYLRRLRQHAAAKEILLPPRLTSFRHFLRFGESTLEKLAAWRGDISPGSLFITPNPDIDRLLAEKKGGLLLCAHLGNFELCRAIGSLQGRTIHAIVFTQHAERFNQLLRENAPGSQINLLSSAELGPATASFLQEKIAAGDWVAIAADRTSATHADRVVHANFLGTPAPFPPGPFLLAAALQCPVFIMLGLRENRRRVIHIETFSPRLLFPRVSRSADLSAAVQRFASRLEHFCLRAPLDWFNFYDFWRMPVPAPKKISSSQNSSASTPANPSRA